MIGSSVSHPGARPPSLTSCSAVSRVDDVLGPWLPGRDPVGDQLRRFEGLRGGLLPRPWARESLAVRVPEPVPFDSALLESQVQLLARMFPHMGEREQANLLDKMGAQVRWATRRPGRCRELLGTVCYAVSTM